MKKNVLTFFYFCTKNPKICTKTASHLPCLPTTSQYIQTGPCSKILLFTTINFRGETAI